MNLKVLEIMSVLSFRIREYEARLLDQRETEKAKLPEVAASIVEAAQALQEATK
jgi:hypothetical protein